MSNICTNTDMYPKTHAKVTQGGFSVAEMSNQTVYPHNGSVFPEFITRAEPSGALFSGNTLGNYHFYIPFYFKGFPASCLVFW